MKGQADYYVMGQRTHVEVETKLLKGRWYSQQIAWRERCAALRIDYLIARPLHNEEPMQTVTRWIGEIAALANVTPMGVTPC